MRASPRALCFDDILARPHQRQEASAPSGVLPRAVPHAPMSGSGSRASPVKSTTSDAVDAGLSTIRAVLQHLCMAENVLVPEILPYNLLQVG